MGTRNMTALGSELYEQGTDARRVAAIKRSLAGATRDVKAYCPI